MGIFSDEKYRPSESRILATALTFSAGFIDAYTYIQRGHTLSAGQTGNVIFFASAFADHNIAGMLNRATTFIAFTLGLLLVGLFHKYVKSNYWRVFCLFPISLVKISHSITQLLTICSWLLHLHLVQLYQHCSKRSLF